MEVSARSLCKGAVSFGKTTHQRDRSHGYEHCPGFGQAFPPCGVGFRASKVTASTAGTTPSPAQLVEVACVPGVIQHSIPVNAVAHKSTRRSAHLKHSRDELLPRFLAVTTSLRECIRHDTDEQVDEHYGKQHVEDVEERRQQPWRGEAQRIPVIGEALSYHASTREHRSPPMHC